MYLMGINVGIAFWAALSVADPVEPTGLDLSETERALVQETNALYLRRAEFNAPLSPVASRLFAEGCVFISFSTRSGVLSIIETRSDPDARRYVRSAIATIERSEFQQEIAIAAQFFCFRAPE